MKHTLKGEISRVKRGKFYEDSNDVWLDGELLDPNPSQVVHNHSSDGFAWGYGGSGPAQLALAIMLELTGKQDGYQAFKWKHIATLPQGSFEIEFEMENKEEA